MSRLVSLQLKSLRVSLWLVAHLPSALCKVQGRERAAKL